MKPWQIVLFVLVLAALLIFIFNRMSKSKKAQEQFSQTHRTVTNLNGAVLYKEDPTVTLGFAPKYTEVALPVNESAIANPLPNPLPVPLTVPFNTQVIIKGKKYSKLASAGRFVGIVPKDYIFYEIETGFLNAKDLS